MVVNKNFEGKEGLLGLGEVARTCVSFIIYMPPLIPFKLDPIPPQNYQQIHC